MDAIVHEGELVKAPPQKNDIMGPWKRWKRRHFKLRKETLEYYADPSGMKLLGLVQLGEVTKLEQNVLHTKYEHVFSLVTEVREYIFAADTKQSMTEWTAALEKVLASRLVEEDGGTDGDYMNTENVKAYQREQDMDVPDISDRVATTKTDQPVETSEGSKAATYDTNTEADDMDNRNSERMAKVRAKYDFDATTAKQLTIREGEVLEVIDNGALWWIVRNSENQEGLAPSNFLDPM